MVRVIVGDNDYNIRKLIDQKMDCLERYVQNNGYLEY